MAQLRSDLLIRLTDRASGPARGILGLMNRLRTVGAGAGGGMAAMGDRATRSMGVLHVKLLAATAAAYGLKKAMDGVVAPAAAFETKLLDIAQKADLSDTGMEAMAGRIRILAKEVGRGAKDVAGGIDVLMGMGMDADSAMGVMPAILKGATAYGAEIEDLSKAGMATMTSLGIKANEFSQALDSMAYAGKAGAFELKEMARYLPSLAAQAGGLKMAGLHGVSDIAAALQAVRKNAGTSEEAATRLSDVFGKLTSDQTVKNFKKAGIKDFAGDLRKAQAAAVKLNKPFSAIDFLVENLNKALKGDIGRVGEIFTDKEAKAGATALMQHDKERRRIRAEAFKAMGTTEADFQRRMKTHEGQMRRFKGAVEDVSISIGNKLLPSLTKFTSHLAGRLNGMDKSVNIFDRMKFAAEGFLSAFGSSGLGDLAMRLDNFIFGDPAKFDQDLRGLSKSFQLFREWGLWVKELVEPLASLQARLTELTGLDLSALAGWALTLGTAALGVSLFAKAVRGLASAIALLTGMKALWAIGKGVASFLPKGAGAPAPTAKPAQPAPAPAVKPRYSFNNATGQWEPKTGSGSFSGGAAGIAGRLRGGIGGLVADFLGKTMIEGLFDAVDKGLKLNTSNRPDPGFMPTLRRLMGTSTGVNIDQGEYERSRRIDQEFRRDPEGARGRAMMRLGQGGDGEQRVRLSTSDLSALLQPKGTQDVRVTNPPPAPNVNVSVVVNATTNASPGQIGSEVGKQVGAQTKRAIEGAFSDAAN